MKASYRKGDPLPYAELLKLEDGAVVWLCTQLEGERGLRANGPFSIERMEAGDGPTWIIGSGEFFHVGSADGECWDDLGGEGTQTLFYAVEKAAR